MSKASRAAPSSSAPRFCPARAAAWDAALIMLPIEYASRHPTLRGPRRRRARDISQMDPDRKGGGTGQANGLWVTERKPAAAYFAGKIWAFAQGRRKGELCAFLRLLSSYAMQRTGIWLSQKGEITIDIPPVIRVDSLPALLAHQPCCLSPCPALFSLSPEGPFQPHEAGLGSVEPVHRLGPVFELQKGREE